MRVVFITDFHHLTGTVESGNRRLTDFLRNEDSRTVTVKDVEVVSYLDPEGRKLQVQQLFLSREAILVAVAEPLPPLVGGTALHIPKVPHRIGAVVGLWELEGFLNLVPAAHLGRALTEQRDQFLPLTNATASFVPNRQQRLGPETFVFNRARSTLLYPKWTAAGT
jgi:hypothetical protein